MACGKCRNSMAWWQHRYSGIKRRCQNDLIPYPGSSLHQDCSNRAVDVNINDKSTSYWSFQSHRKQGAPRTSSPNIDFARESAVNIYCSADHSVPHYKRENIPRLCGYSEKFLELFCRRTKWKIDEWLFAQAKLPNQMKEMSSPFLEGCPYSHDMNGIHVLHSDAVDSSEKQVVHG